MDFLTEIFKAAQEAGPGLTVAIIIVWLTGKLFTLLGRTAERENTVDERYFRLVAISFNRLSKSTSDLHELMVDERQKNSMRQTALVASLMARFDDLEDLTTQALTEECRAEYEERKRLRKERAALHTEELKEMFRQINENA